MKLEDVIEAWGLEAVEPPVTGRKQTEKPMVVVSKKPAEGGTFTPHPEGQFAAVCVDVHDLGMVETTWQGETKKQHKIDIYFYCGEDKKLDNGDSIPLLVRERFTATLSDKGRLKPFLVSWRGQRFTDEEEQAFEMDNMIGAAALLTVEHKESGDKVFANIVAISRLPKQMANAKPTVPADFVRMQDREKKQQDTPSPLNDADDERYPGPLDNDDDDLPF